MSTRSGDIDPGLVRYMSEKKHMTAAEFDQMVNKESGLLGMSGISADMGDLLKSAPSDPIAALAIDVFCYRIRLAIGALTAAMGGISAMVFTGGIGENAPTVRAKICEKLLFLGLPDTIPIYVIHTDEQREIAFEVQALL
jgi:acetate kinase